MSRRKLVDLAPLLLRSYNEAEKFFRGSPSETIAEVVVRMSKAGDDEAGLRLFFRRSPETGAVEIAKCLLSWSPSVRSKLPKADVSAAGFATLGLPVVSWSIPARA